MLCGTALMMSSDSEDTKGITMIPITIPAVITEDELLPSPIGSANQSRSSGPTVISANRP